MRYRCLTVMTALAVLLGCADAPPQRSQATCCATLAQPPYRPLAVDAPLRASIDATAPRFTFATGPSPFAAFRLPEGPRPLVLDLQSHQVGGPGVIEQVFKVDKLLGRKAEVFHPMVLILDHQHRVRRTLLSAGPTEFCNLLDVGGRGPVVRMHVPINDPADESAYLVIATTQALRSRTGDTLCEDVPLAGSERGEFELALHAPAVQGRQILLDAAARWYRDRRQPDVVDQMALGFSGMTRGRLMLDDDGLSYHELDGGRLVQRVRLPLAQIAHASLTDKHLPVLSVGSVSDTGRALSWQAFLFAQSPAAPDAGESDFQARVAERIAPDRFVEDVGFTVDRFEPAVGLNVRPGKRRGDSALERVGQDAAVTGIVAALPCGLCQTGACSPDMLGACAAAFTVGAVIGGVWSAGREWLGGGPKEKPAAAKPAPSPDTARAAVAPLGPAARTRFDAAALQQCMADAVVDGSVGVWRAQGITARWQPMPTTDGATARRPIARAVVSAVALEVRDDTASGTPSAQAPAQLVIKGEVRLGGDRTVALSWASEARSLAHWAEADATQIGIELDQACRALGGQATTAAHAHWRRHLDAARR